MNPHAQTYAHRQGHTDGQAQMDQLWYKINVLIFMSEKAGIKCLFYEYIFNI